MRGKCFAGLWMKWNCPGIRSRSSSASLSRKRSDFHDEHHRDGGTVDVAGELTGGGADWDCAGAARDAGETNLAGVVVRDVDGGGGKVGGAGGWGAALG